MAIREGALWARWNTDQEWAYTIGIEEEIMLLDPTDWMLAHRIESVMPRLSGALREHVTAETHSSALELATGVHETVPSAIRELSGLRTNLEVELEPMALRAASAATHPFAVWQDIVISEDERFQELYGSMRELARREPTFALHVHVGVPNPEAAIRLHNRMRCHLALLLALSVNSPFWQGRDTGLASARTPLFQAFPRVGTPRAFDDYAAYVEAVDMLIRYEAFSDPSYLWWDVRPQPRFGTVEIRIMDAQTTVEGTAALVALIQSLARLEVEEGFVSEASIDRAEVLEENRFLAARDGMHARLIDPAGERRVAARELLDELLEVCRPHAEVLGCETELASARALGASSGADRQIEVHDRAGGLPPLVCALAEIFAPAADASVRLEAG